MRKRTFSKEFKKSVLAELDSGKTVSLICNKYNLGPSLVYKWRSEQKQNPKLAFPGRGKISKIETKLAEMERLVGQLFAENLFLKKVHKNLRESIMEEKLKRSAGGSTK